MDSWANIPTDILLRIFKRLNFIKDIIVVGDVCKSWRSCAPLSDKVQIPPYVPWLMLAEECKWGLPTNIVDEPRRFYNLLDDKIYSMNLPETIGRKCRGVGFGWILTVSLDFQINLIHPFSKLQINLPPKSNSAEGCRCHQTLYEHTRLVEIRKAVASIDPWNADTQQYDPKCVIMTISSVDENLTFIRLGDKTWTNVQMPPVRFSDIVFYGDKFYGVDLYYDVFVLTIEDWDISKATRVAHIPSFFVNFFSQKYLVKSNGDLLLVCRSFDNTAIPYVTKHFEVLKLKSKEELMHKNNNNRRKHKSRYDCELVKIKSLDNHALFVGDTSSFSLSASRTNGIKGNCIYFTDNYFMNYSVDGNGSGSDMGVYNLEDDSVVPHYTGPESLSYFCSPQWYV
ncbi:hypothetical protein ACFE04_014766 [Oxalis oulophora]